MKSYRYSMRSLQLNQYFRLGSNPSQKFKDLLSRQTVKVGHESNKIVTSMSINRGEGRRKA